MRICVHFEHLGAFLFFDRNILSFELKLNHKTPNSMKMKSSNLRAVLLYIARTYDRDD